MNAFLNAHEFNSENIGFYCTMLESLCCQHQIESPTLILTKITALSTSKMDHQRWASCFFIKIFSQYYMEPCKEKWSGWLSNQLGNLKKQEPKIYKLKTLDTIAFLCEQIHASVDGSKIMNASLMNSLMTCFKDALIKFTEIKINLLPCLLSIMRLFPTQFRPMRSQLLLIQQEILLESLSDYTNKIKLSLLIDFCIQLEIIFRKDKSLSNEQRMDIASHYTTALDYFIQQALICMELGFLFSPYMYLLIWNLDIENHKKLMILPKDNLFYPYISKYILDDYVKQLPEMMNGIQALLAFGACLYQSSDFEAEQVDVQVYVNALKLVYNVSSCHARDGRNPEEYPFLLLVISGLYCPLIHFIQTVIARLGDLLLGNALEIFKLCISCLEKSKLESHRMACYQLIQTCIDCIPSFTCKQEWNSFLFNELEKDWIMTIEPHYKEIEQGQQQYGKKRIKINETSNRAHQVKNVLLKVESLKVFKSILRSSSIPYSLVQEILNDLMRLTYGPFKEHLCVFHSLLIQVTAGIVSCPFESPCSRLAMPFALRLFTKSLHSPSLMIQEESKQGLESCAMILHPRLPPLNVFIASSSLSDGNHVVKKESNQSNSIIPPKPNPSVFSSSSNVPNKVEVEEEPKVKPADKHPLNMSLSLMTPLTTKDVTPKDTTGHILESTKKIEKVQNDTDSDTESNDSSLPEIQMN